MGHYIQAIVANEAVAERIRAEHPQLVGVRVAQGFVVLPVDATFVDSVAIAHPTAEIDEFVLLTIGFRDVLTELSRFGPIAYIETEYHGGSGGQGAAVYANRDVLMEPQWSECGPINLALKLLGVRRRILGDRFSALGLQRFRFNDDLIEEAQRSGERH